MRAREHVLVVGGGIAGLALAAALDPRRVRVTLVEERPERAGAGTVLALWRGGRDALDDLGVGDRVRADSLPVVGGDLRDRAGGVLHGLRVPDERRPPLWFAPRPDLVAALESALAGSVTRLTRQVTDPRALAAEVGADLVVGADGVRSVCRQRAFEGTAPVVTGWIALRGHLPGPALRTATEWWGSGGVFGRTPGPQGAAWFCAVRAEGRSLTVDPAEGLALAREHFADWDPEVRDILAAVGHEADAQRILLAPPLRSSVDDGMVLVGDAAHAMAPNLGRGANEALEDAVTLAEAIHRHGTKGAPAAFARRRHLRGQALRVGSSLALRVETARRGAGLRDRVVRLLPG